VELPNERITAQFNEDSRLELTPELVGPCEVLLEGIVGEGVTLDLKHLGEVRPSSVSYHLAKHLLFRKFRDPGEEPKLHLFGQLKQIARRWIDEGYLICKGGTFPAQLLYQEIADKAADRIYLACQRGLEGEKRIKAIPEPDVEVRTVDGDQVEVEIKGVDVFDPQTGEVRSGGTDDIAAWFIDTDYDEESFFGDHRRRHLSGAPAHHRHRPPAELLQGSLGRDRAHLHVPMVARNKVNNKEWDAAHSALMYEHPPTNL
jgi:hypothetical protein